LFPLPLTASGKVLLAYMSDDERNTTLKNNAIFKKYPKAQQEDFLTSLEDIQQTGSYFKNSDSVSGVTDLSVPIGINGNNGIIACLTISMLNAINVDQAIENDVILSEAYKCVKKIEQRIGV